MSPLKNTFTRSRRTRDRNILEFNRPPNPTGEEDGEEETAPRDGGYVRYVIGSTQDLRDEVTREVGRVRSPSLTEVRTPPMFFQHTPYQLLDPRKLLEASVPTQQEYIGLRARMPCTPRALVTLSPREVTSDKTIIEPPRRLVLKDSQCGPFRLGHSLYAHGSISGVWELGDEKGRTNKKVYIEWINREERHLAIVEMGIKDLYQNKRQRVMTLLRSFRTRLH
ncbi:hypothetical protein C8R46DRAFT_1028988 [Mycena filopes]|nr:hypothetical protein C8R46DRAFT_1028988 [Mycena filopes]